MSKLTPAVYVDEGKTVKVTIVEPAATLSDLDVSVTHRLKSAKSIAEWVAATRLLPSDDGGYDIVKALDENRAWSGERRLSTEADSQS